MYSVFYKFDNRTQQIITLSNTDTSFLDGPSTSGLSSLACATASGATAAAATAAVSPTQCLESHNSPVATSENSTLFNNQNNPQQLNSPNSPNSSTSTAVLMSPPLSPLEQNFQLCNNVTPQPSITNNATVTATTTTINTMPAKYHQPVPVIITATTTDNIMEGNRFSLLAGKDIVTNELDIYSLPTNNLHLQENLNNSSGTTISQITPSGSPHKTNNGSLNGSLNNSPIRKKHQQRNHNNNQGDVNSIESVTEDSESEKIPSGDLDWVDTIVENRQDREILAKPEKKNKKKKRAAKELDQLDGIPIKENTIDESIDKEDEKVVKCLYYTLMCCDCTIS